MKAIEVLAAFGSTSRVGLLHPGARLREVAAIYGMPWDIGRIDPRHRWEHLYSYGDVEFVVCRCRIVVSVSVPTWRGYVELPEAQSGEFTSVAARLTLDQVVDALAALDCQWEPLTPIEGQRGLRTLPERVEFTFVTDEGPEPVLHGAGTWAYEHDCMPASAVATAFADDFPPEQVDDTPPA